MLCMLCFKYTPDSISQIVLSFFKQISENVEMHFLEINFWTMRLCRVESFMEEIFILNLIFTECIFTETPAGGDAAAAAST